ncbi:MAG: hypothetical protein DDT21_02652 [Syntrophomonadaceae bacterium]|nr:hypothetical protein [Bacillota bacterium]
MFIEAVTDINPPTRTQRIIDDVMRVVPLWQQQQVFRAQLRLEEARARAGGGPLQTENLAVPGVPVTVGVQRGTLAPVLIGVGLLAVVLLMKKR